MVETGELVRRIFRAYEQNTSPRGERMHRTTSDGKTTVLCVQSGRGDMVVAEHIVNSVFAAIRVEGVTENGSSRARRVATNPTASPQKQFDHCEYQLLVFDDEAVRNGGGAQALFQACHWNRDATAITTTSSQRQIVRAWENHVQNVRSSYSDAT